MAVFFNGHEHQISVFFRRLAIASYDEPSRLALDAHCSPKKNSIYNLPRYNPIFKSALAVAETMGASWFLSITQRMNEKIIKQQPHSCL